MKKLKKAAPKLARGAFRVGVAVATAGAVARADELADAGIEAAAKEVNGATDDFWKTETSRTRAMKNFEKSLRALTVPKPSSDETDQPAAPQKIVVVIDELDRCRPDYALSMLEVIKHFFAVPNVHFVLGVNLKELQNSVRARYGAEIDAETYLQKFISFNLLLPTHIDEHRKNEANLTYFSHIVKEMDLPQNLSERLTNQLLYFSNITSISIRHIQRIASNAALTPNAERKNYFYQQTIACLILTKTLFPTLFDEIYRGTTTFESVTKTLKLTAELKEDRLQEHIREELLNLWTYWLSPRDLSRDAFAEIYSQGNSSQVERIPDHFREILTSYFDTVNLAQSPLD